MNREYRKGMTKRVAERLERRMWRAGIAEDGVSVQRIEGYVYETAGRCEGYGFSVTIATPRGRDYLYERTVRIDSPAEWDAVLALCARSQEEED